MSPSDTSSARSAEARAYHPPTMADQLSLPLDATVDRLPDLPDLRPMLPRPLPEPFDSEGHLFEPWWGGARALVFVGPADRPGDGDVRIVDPSFKEDVDRWSYRVGVSQILTRNSIISLGLEVITDEGYLNNPYRSFRYVDPEDDTNYRLATEIYPRTRTSNAASLNGRYFMPWRAAVFGGYRFFTDTWGIDANTFELGYMHPLKSTGWTFEASYRYYDQGHADFYSDLFPRVDYQNFMGRDKELSTFVSQTFHVGASYEFARGGWKFVKKGTFNIFYDRMQFDYEDYRDARDTSLVAGTEPFYSFGANVIQAFVSIWF